MQKGKKTPNNVKLYRMRGNLGLFGDLVADAMLQVGKSARPTTLLSRA